MEDRTDPVRSTPVSRSVRSKNGPTLCLFALPKGTYDVITTDILTSKQRVYVTIEIKIYFNLVNRGIKVKSIHLYPFAYTNIWRKEIPYVTVRHIERTETVGPAPVLKNRRSGPVQKKPLQHLYIYSRNSSVIRNSHILQYNMLQL